MIAVLELPLPAGYCAAEILAYHGRDPASVSERVDGAVLVKPLRLGGGPAEIAIDLSAGAVAMLRADRELDAAEAGEVRRIAGRMLGLASDPEGFAYIAERSEAGAALAALRPGLRIPLTANIWESICWAVIGQQINLTFAAALRRAMIERAGVPAGRSGLRLHPGPAEVAALVPGDLTALRFSRSKAAYLIDVARLVADGTVDLAAIASLPAAEAEAALVSLRGIGPWTARYILLRGAGHADIAPVGDSGLATALQRLLGLAARPDIAAQEAAMQAFSPHRSLATTHLWASLAPVQA